MFFIEELVRLFLDFDGVVHPFFYRHTNKAFCYVPRLETVLKSFPTVQIVISGAQRDHKSLAQLAQCFSSD